MKIGCFFIMWYLLLPALCFWGAKLKRNGFFLDNLDRDQCNAIKGISIYLVLTGHMLSYITSCEQWDPYLFQNRLFGFIGSFIGQLMVVMFMFYTGFGIMESLKKKGNDYIRTFPLNRILKVLLNFDIAVLAYLALSLVLCVRVTVGNVLLSLLGWESLGNSNWYICVILLCYALFWFSFHPAMPWKRREAQLATFSILIVALAIVLSITRSGEEWWWNKLMVVPFGVCVSIYREQLQDFADRHYRSITSCVLLLLCLHYAFFLALRFLRISWPSPNCGVAFNIRSLLLQWRSCLSQGKSRLEIPC